MVRTPSEAVRWLMAQTMVDEDGNPVEVRPMAPLTEAEIARREARYGGAFPPEIRELLLEMQGLEVGADEILFAPEDEGDGWGVFPHSREMMPDGAGNTHAIAPRLARGEWGPVWYVCHDPPVVAFQSPDLATFLSDLGNCYLQPKEAKIYTHRFGWWKRMPGKASLPLSESLVGSSDPELAAFAQELGEGWTVADLRNAKLDDGFDWGSGGPDPEVRRFGDTYLFALKWPERKGLFSRLFGR